MVLLARQRGDDEARIGLPFGPLRLGDNPALTAPTGAGAPGKVLEAALGFARPLAQLGRRGEFGSDLADQSAIARQAEQKVDAVVLAPGHQPVAGKARIGAQQNTYCRPAASNVGDDPAHLFDAAGTRVDVGRAQFGRQQMPAAEHIKRQIAVIVVIAVKEALFLVPVQRVVGGVEIKDDLRRDRGMGVEKEIDEQAFDFRRVIADPVITRRFRPAQLQPVERRLVGFRAPGKST